MISDIILLSFCITDGQLTNMETGHGFVFDVVPYDHSYNQRRYEALGSVSTTLSRVSQLCTYVQCYICTSDYDAGCILPTVYRCTQCHICTSERNTVVSQLCMYVHCHFCTFVCYAVVSNLCTYVCSTLSHLYK